MLKLQGVYECLLNRPIEFHHHKARRTPQPDSLAYRKHTSTFKGITIRGIHTPNYHWTTRKEGPCRPTWNLFLGRHFCLLWAKDKTPFPVLRHPCRMWAFESPLSACLSFGWQCSKTIRTHPPLAPGTFLVMRCNCFIRNMFLFCMNFVSSLHLFAQVFFPSPRHSYL